VDEFGPAGSARGPTLRRGGLSGRRDRRERDEEQERDEEPEREAARAGNDDEGGPDGEPRRRRRRGRRGGRRHRARRNAFEGTFDHGEEDGYGLWLDPAVVDNPVYSQHWAGHRDVTVTVEPDAITIRRTDSDRPDAGGEPEPDE
jgi:hypothetical protein